jgi:hypothetical protein
MVNNYRSCFRTSRVFPLLLAALLCSAPLLAATQTVFIPGDHHLLRVHEVRSNPRHAPTSLRWTLVGTGGHKLEGVIPGTDGPEFDAYPVLVNDLDSGDPVLVWSRHNGVDYDLAFTRFDGESWTLPLTLVGTVQDEIQARVYAIPGGEFHLVWNWPSDKGSFVYGLFRLDGGVAVIEPERILSRLGPRGDEQWLPEGGLDDPGTGRSMDCDGDLERCPCDYTSSGCSTGPASEGATVCNSLSLVVGSGSRTCVLTRTAEGWSLGTCQPFRGGKGAEELLRSLGKLSNSTCP